MQNPEVKFEILHMPPQNTNSVLVASGTECVIFDAWGRAADWEKLLSSRGLNLRAIYSTHGHPDHISAAQELADKYGAPWYLNKGDWDLIGWGNELLDFFEIPHIDSAVARPTDLTPGRHEILPGVFMDAIATPGHSAGGMAFYFPEYQILLTGDTLFRDSFGRYDFPGGDRTALGHSIAALYDLNLPDETYVVHGHGLDSTIAMLKRHNPNFKPMHSCCNSHEHHHNGNCTCHDDCCCHGGHHCCCK